MILQSSEASNRHKRTSSGKTKQSAEAKQRGTPLGAPSGTGGIVRVSPYVRRTANRGSNEIKCGGASSSFNTQRVSSGASLRTPAMDAVTLGGTLSIATTFVASVISLCSKSIASCSVMSEPVPREDMFLHLVSLCGVAEAKYWAEILDFEHTKSYTLLSRLL